MAGLGPGSSPSTAVPPVSWCVRIRKCPRRVRSRGRGSSLAARSASHASLHDVHDTRPTGIAQPVVLIFTIGNLGPDGSRECSDPADSSGLEGHNTLERRLTGWLQWWIEGSSNSALAWARPGHFAIGGTMTTRRNLRFSWIAIAAIVGMSWLPGNSRADMSEVRSNGRAPSCCNARRCPAGCCKGVQGPGPVRPALVKERGGLSVPASSCECQSSEPISPASKPELRSTRSCTERDFGRSVVTSARGYPVTKLVAQHIEFSSHPPEDPLYLRNARLLI